jgi:hypothetical protein
VLVALAAGALVLGPALSATAKGDSLDQQRQNVRQRSSKAASQLNVLKASDAQVQSALAALRRNVESQQAAVAGARQAADIAAAELLTARKAEDEKAAELADLKARLKRMAVDAYVNPPTSNLLNTLNSGSLDEATRKRELLDYQLNRGSDLADRTAAARQDLTAKREQAEAARKRAQQRKAQVEARLGELQQAQDQQARFADDLDARIDQVAGELVSLDVVDKALAGKIAARNAALAAQARAAGAGRSGGGRSSRSGSRSAGGGVSVTTVRGITVASSIADNLDRLMGAADSAGLHLGGSGYRDSSQQVALRRAHCGSSDYEIYEAPASSCSPPTARPGSSMHERGLAVDFTCNGSLISSRGSPCFRWLSGNAAGYGFYNLPSEPWHWSTNGN